MNSIMNIETFTSKMPEREKEEEGKEEIRKKVAIVRETDSSQSCK